MRSRPTGAGGRRATGHAPAARRFHGWRIVVTLAVTETVSWGVLYYAFSVLLLPMQADLGLSTAALTGVFSWSVLLTGLAAVPVGRWLDAHGARSLMTAGSVVAALLVVAWSQVNGLTALFAVFTGIGLVRAAVLYEAAFAVVVRWFHTKRSTALLTITVVAGFASTIFLPTTQVLTDAFGWRGALLVLAGLLAVVTVLPHWLVLRRDPRDVDQWPDGEPPPAAPRRETQSAGTDSGPAAAGPSPDRQRLRETARGALGDPVYRWFAAGFAANALAVIVVSVHLVPYLREQGHSASFAAVAAGSLGALSVSGRLIVTSAARRWSPVLIAAATFGLQGAAVLLLLLRGSSTAGAVGFVVLFGLGFGVATITRPAVLAQTYGTEQYATLSGLMAVVLTLATTLGPVTAGVLRTTTGDYTAVLIGLVLVCVVSAGALLRAGAVADVASPTSGFTQSSFDPLPTGLVTSTRAADNNSD